MEEFQREDLKMIPKAIEVGWTPLFSHSDILNHRNSIDNFPQDSISFKKENKVTWSSINTTTHKSKWNVADLIESKYWNHRSYDTLEKVFKNE